MIRIVGMSNSLLLVVRVSILLTGILSVEVQTSAADLKQAFQSPPTTARPWLRWWWPGGAVDDNELRREIGLMHAAGFGGAEIQPFNPGIPNLTEAERAAVNDYATPTFFAHVASSAAEAAKRDFQIDYTFGSAWPSGGGGAMTPELALPELTMASTEIVGPSVAPVKVAVPARTAKFGTLAQQMPGAPRLPDDWRSRIDALQKIVAVVAVKGDAPELKKQEGPSSLTFNPFGTVAKPGVLQSGTALVLTDRLRADGTLDWAPPPGTWQVLVFKQYVSDGIVLGAAGNGPQLVLDHFNRAAFDAHAGRVADAGLGQISPFFGHSFRATFVDSLELVPDIYWSHDFLEQFHRRRGYDLTPYLPLIVTPGWMTGYGGESAPLYEMGETGERVRADYRRTVSELMLENFYQPFVDWNHRHGLQARLQAHGAPVDWLKAYGFADIPETEDLGGATRDFRILAWSAADIYGHQIVSSESFVWPGQPYSVTPAMWKQRADLLFASGVNEIVGHGFTYVFHAETWPGWYAFAPSPFTAGFSSMLNPADPLWAVVPTLTTYITRMQAVMRATRNVVPVAVYLSDLAYHPHADEGLDKALYREGYDYDRLNADGLAKSRVEDGHLVTPGGHRFSALVFPHVAALPAEAAEIVRIFAQQGLPVVFTDGVPERDEGFSEKEQRDARVRGAMSGAVNAGARTSTLSDLASILRKLKVAPNLTFRDGDAVSFVEKTDGMRRLYFVANDRDASKPVAFTVNLPTPAGAEIWSGWTGEIQPQPVIAAPDGLQVELVLPPNGSAIVVFDPASPPVASNGIQTAPPVLSERAVNGPWDFHAEGHGFGGRNVKLDTKLAALADWGEVKGVSDLAGTGTYRTVLKVGADFAATGHSVILDLGAVHDAATVTVNRMTFPSMLFPPFKLDITQAIRAGDNALTVEVVNMSQNAMVDPSATGFSAPRTLPAGLIGPVMFESCAKLDPNMNAR
jgi:hypothetical protein